MVQQQTCPTCRGDIAAMEARQKQQDMLDARREEQQQQQQEQQQNPQEEETSRNEETDDDGAKEDQPSSVTQVSSEDKSTHSTNEAPELTSESQNETDSNLSSRTKTLADKEEKEIPTKSNSFPLLHHREVSSKETSAFPAFYRVVRDTGAPVYADEEDETQSSFTVLRLVACGVVFLGMSLEYRKCVLTNKMMIRMPDGWVSEDDVERIVAVPLSSPQSQ